MTRVTIDNVVIQGATRAEQRGGWNAPEERVETGFDYSSYVAAQPWEITLEAWVDERTFARLERLHEQGEPFPASVGDFALENVKFSSGGFRVTDTGRSHYEVNFSLEEVVFAEVETAEVEFDAPGGSVSSGADSTDASTGSSESDSGGILQSTVNTVSGFADSMASSLF